MLEFRQVSAAYQKQNILREIDAIFRPGELTVIIGPNGSGKSTLLQCLTRTVNVTSGTIEIDGLPFLSLPPRQRARTVAILPQIRSVIPSIPSRALVEHGRFPYQGFIRRRDSQDENIVQEAMEFTRTLPYASIPTDRLSGGERQRVFFAMALAQDTPYLVLDEPTTYLDIEAQFLLLRQLKRLTAQGKAVILVLHDLAQAFQTADSLIVLEQGRLLMQAAPEQCLAASITEKVFHVRCKQIMEDGEKHYIFSLFRNF